MMLDHLRKLIVERAVDTDAVIVAELHGWECSWYVIRQFDHQPTNHYQLVEHNMGDYLGSLRSGTDAADLIERALELWRCDDADHRLDEARNQPRSPRPRPQGDWVREEDK